jgi:Spy/CpxP family protein refolding chaperone
MVDSVNGSGGLQNLTQVNRTQNSKNADKRVENSEKAVSVDEVRISEEALGLAEAEATARETRTILEQQLEEVLSPEGGKKVDKLL